MDIILLSLLRYFMLYNICYNVFYPLCKENNVAHYHLHVVSNMVILLGLWYDFSYGKVDVNFFTSIYFIKSITKRDFPLYSIFTNHSYDQSGKC